MKSEATDDQICLGCQIPFAKNVAKVSIFDKDETLQKCFAYKIHQITGEDLTYEDKVQFICLDCRDLLAQIYSLELKFRNSYYGLKTTEEVEYQSVEDSPTKTEYLTYSGGNQEYIEQKPELSDSEVPLDKLKQPITCKICDVVCSSWRRRTAHMKEAHPESIKDLGTATCKEPVICHVCSKTFANRRNLNVHMVVHTGDKPHECGVCHMKFALRDRLKKHMVKHTGERPHLCKDCGRSFPYKSSLRVHQQSAHGEEKPFKCEHCDYATYTSTKLRDHTMSIHTGEKPEMCEYCEKTFVRKENLKAHVREVHLGVKYVRKAQRPQTAPEQQYIIVVRKEGAASTE